MSAARLTDRLQDMPRVSAAGTWEHRPKKTADARWRCFAGLFFNFLFVAYLINPRWVHSFVGCELSPPNHTHNSSRP